MCGCQTWLTQQMTSTHTQMRTVPSSCRPCQWSLFSLYNSHCNVQKQLHFVLILLLRCPPLGQWQDRKTKLEQTDRTTTLMDRCMVYYVRASKIGLHFDGQVYCVHTNKTQCDHHYCMPKQNNITGYHLYCSGHFSLKDKVQNQHELHDNILDTFISKLWR